MEVKDIYRHVSERYGSMTRTQDGNYENTVATAFGYSEEELVGLPEGANLGLSCGNPLALAKLREGEVIIDLGCGAGFDVFIAARSLGRSGRAVGIDMNENMIAKAQSNKSKLVDATNIEFIQAPITDIPCADETADCIISNCVINLVPSQDKHLVFKEMFRLLKPGGRLAVSDMLARKEMTLEMKQNLALYVGCISGASLVQEYETYLKEAGFKDVLIVDSKNDLNVYLNASEGTSCCDASDGNQKPVKNDDSKMCCGSERSESSPSVTAAEVNSMNKTAREMTATSGVADLNEWAGSFHIYAVKPSH